MEWDKAVITVPAYFENSAREATKDASMIAGLSIYILFFILKS